MTPELHPAVESFLGSIDMEFEVMACDAELADTLKFCEHYGVSPEDSANAILVKAKAAEPRYALCVLLATHRLNVNHTVRKKLETRRISFASAEETRALTGMEIGGVTPLALPATLPIWVDEHVMEREYIVLGGGNRTSKLKLSPAVFDHVPSVEVLAGMVREP